MARYRKPTSYNAPNIVAAIDLFDAMTLDELRSASDILSEAWKRKQAALVTTFKVGDAVSFVSTRGFTVEGKVIRCNQKTVTLTGTGKFAGREWKASPSILTKI